MKETEEKLTDLQGQHNKLMQSYERLLIEYSAMKQELETFRSKYENIFPTPRNYFGDIKESDALRADHSDPLLFDISRFCYELEEHIE